MSLVAVGERIGEWMKAPPRSISSALVDVKPGPEIAWIYVIGQGSGEAAARLVQNANSERALCFEAGLPEARIRRSTAPNGAPLLVVMTPNPRPGVVHGHKMTGHKLSVPLGLRLGVPPVGDPRQTWAWVDLAAKSNPHLRIIGASGMGKTSVCIQMVRCLCQQNPPDALSVLVISDRRDSWNTLDTLPHSYGLVHRPVAEAAVSWVAEEVERRERDGGAHPWLFAVLDDCADTLDAFPSLREPLAIIARRGRAASVGLLPNTQGPGKDEIGGPQVHNSALDNVTLRVADGDAARRSTGVSGSGANKIARRGVGVLTIDGVSQDVAFARAAPTDLLAIPQGTPRPRPWQRVQVQGYTRPGVSAISGISAYEDIEDWSEAPTVIAPEGLTPLIALTDREKQFIPLLRQLKSSHEIGVELTGQKGGPTYQECVREVKEFICRLLPAEREDG